MSELSDQEKQSITSVLTAALHNAEVLKDQVDSLVNPDDDSFTDYKVGNVVSNMNNVITSIQNSIKELNG